MFDIPTDLFPDILSRVPAEHLFRFRSVCKGWRGIIDDPLFIKLHLHHQDGGDQLIIKNQYGKIYSFSLGSLNQFECGTTETIEVIKLKNLPRSGFPWLSVLPVTSCNGLIVLTGQDEIPWSHEKKQIFWVIWNPFTSKSLKLPSYGNGYHRPCVGLGYDEKTDHYKFLHIHLLETSIYSLKSRKWRRIENIPDCKFPYGNGVFLNGSLHWITNDYIIALDLETETYRLMPMPLEFSKEALSVEKKYLRRRLNVLGGCLFLSCYHNNRELLRPPFEVWIMKDYNSWVKLFSLNNHNNKISDPMVIAYLKSKGQVLVQYNTNKFLWFDVEKKSLKKIRIDEEGYDKSCGFSSQVFPVSFVKLNNNKRGFHAVEGSEIWKKKSKKARDVWDMTLTTTRSVDNWLAS